MNFKMQTKDQLENFVLENWDNINHYLENLRKDLPVPFYSSVDIRESKYKYAPVDHNMFPAGFNNLCSQDLIEAIPVIKKALSLYALKNNHIAILAESHTKNTMYLDHLVTLKKLIIDCGYNVEFISFDSQLFPENEAGIDLISNNGTPLTIYRGSINLGHLNTIKINKFDLCICNNDQSNPAPISWKDLLTPVAPTPLIGWFRRQKNTHFYYYQKVANEFCQQFNINPNLIQAKFRAVENVDFESKSGLDQLGHAVDELILELNTPSKVFVKASQGTYGMGISVVSSGEEIINMNRKTRNKMDIGKNSIKFTSLLVQEGVETILKYDDMPAEITIYLINGDAIGGFMRVNGEKDSLGNLNSRGMVFKKLCMCTLTEKAKDYTTKEAMYSLLARLSTIASAYEIKEVV